MSKVLGLQIPIPHLAIQAEIVRILNAFTALIAALIAELTARKKQYLYYRDQLLSFESFPSHPSTQSALFCRIRIPIS